MFPMTIPDYLLTMATGLLLMGLICIASGIILLVVKAAGQDVRTIADQTSKLAQKGLAEDVAGLVGNASALITAMNQMVRTTAGIGIFLIVAGVLMIGGSYFLVTQIA
ncbi:MAG TPA: hypothetical protein VHO48_03905 [Anaerolineaceae bacterium]|nr:hypothetical protein [Anaerolineaceae bacterium]